MTEVRSTHVVVRRQVIIFVAAIAAVCGLVWLVATHAPSNPPSAPSAAPAPRPVPSPSVQGAQQAAERLRVLQLESASLMPDDVRGVYIGLRREELVALRPRAVAARGAPEGHTLMQEVLTNGAVVAYIISARIDRVAQVQFLSRLPQPTQLVDHYLRLRQRYGDPTGFMDCPQRGDTAPTRRVLWVGREVSVMEAILAHPGGISLTLAVAGNGEVRSALRVQGCRPVTRESFADWPIATELRGERVPVRRN